MYLRTLAHRLLLTQQAWTDPLYELLAQTDHLVALVRRLQAVWAAADLEADVGVVDAFVDLAREERDVREELRAVEARVRRAIEGLVAELRRIEGSGALLAAGATGGGGDGDGDGDCENGGGGGGREDKEGGDADDDGDEEEVVLPEEGEYVPCRVGGLDRLLMKLDFGGWFGSADGEALEEGHSWHDEGGF